MSVDYIMNIVASIRRLCTPAYLYLIISSISALGLMLQNTGSSTTFCAGSFQCDTPSVLGIFVGQFVYIAFWTFVLDALCKAGYRTISWFVFLFPLILFFVVLGIGMVASNPRMIDRGFSIIN